MAKPSENKKMKIFVTHHLYSHATFSLRRVLSYKLLKKHMKFNMNHNSDNVNIKEDAKLFSNSTDKIISGFSRSYQEEEKRKKS